MELVADDKNGKWYFDGDRTYLFMQGDKVSGRMFIEFVPDPLALWKSKCIAANVDMGSPEAERYKSNDVVYKLWEHKQGVTNA